MQLRHVGIVTDSLDLSIEFYSRFFGCKVYRKMDEIGSFISNLLGYEDVDVTTVKLAFPTGNSQIEFLHFKKPATINSNINLNSTGLTHIAIQVENLNSLYNSMKQDGVQFISNPILSEDKKAKVCFCKDPYNQVFIELVELLD